MRADYTIPATLESVSNFTQRMEARFQRLPDETRTKLLLGLHELLVNITVHAYAGETGYIDIALTQVGDTLTIVVSDAAMVDFQQPTTIPEPDAESLPEHGMGLFIIHQTFDTVTYERLVQGNRWHLTTRLPAGDTRA